jgi:DNA polymerase (family 10)
MTNKQVADIFSELAELLLKKKESWFKIRAYRKAADEIEKQSEDLFKMANEGRLRKIPGVGDAIEKKINEILSTGKLQLLERLRAEIGESKIEQPRKQ